MYAKLKKEIREVKEELDSLKKEAVKCMEKVSYMEETLKRIYEYQNGQTRRQDGQTGCED
jgi:hypothetical protein